jgi:hypothetical protein
LVIAAASIRNIGRRYLEINSAPLRPRKKLTEGLGARCVRRSRVRRQLGSPRNFHIISALGRAIPASFIVARADEVIE